MTDIRPTEPMEPYLDPDFWDGHMIGDGDAASFLEEYPFGPADRQSNRYGKQVLKERLPLMQALVPFQKFEKGMLFDAGEHPNGTILLYKKHNLETLSEASAERLAKKPFAIHDEPSLELNLGLKEGSARVIVSDRLMYTAQTLWGVITQTRKGEPAILSYDQSYVFRTSSTNVELFIREPNAQQSHFRIGESKHYKLRHEEHLEKVTQLYICGYGRAKKVRKTGRQLVNSLIPRPVLASPVLGINREY